MHTFTFSISLVAIAISVSHADPLAQQLLRSSKTTLRNVYLVTTTQSTPEAKSADLANVSATSLFDPFHQPNYLLRLIGETYNSLPKFNLTNGVLNTLTNGIDPRTMYVYNSTDMQAGSKLQFLTSEQSKGNLALKDGCLLTVDEESEGWVICDGTFGYRVISWKASDPSCTATYIQAVADAPY